MTDKTTIPAGSITVGMVTAGAEEVANYYDDGNDLRHREVARFVFQAMQRAAPSAAQIAVGPNVAVQDVAEQVERRVNERAEAAEARATTAEAALADLPRLIAVVGKLTGAPMDDPSGYGLDDCVAMLEEHEAAVAGIGWQIGLTGETERADRAEKRIAAAVSDASRHERLWRAAMRGTAAYRALLAASLERERVMREAARPVADAFSALSAGWMGEVPDEQRLIAPDITVGQMRQFCAALQPQETADER